MAWVSPRVYAILSKSEEGKDIIEQLPDMTQDECSQALDEFFGKSGKGYKSNAEYSQAKMDDETEERIYKEMGDEEVSEKDDEDDDYEEEFDLETEKAKKILRKWGYEPEEEWTDEQIDDVVSQLEKEQDISNTYKGQNGKLYNRNSGAEVRENQNKEIINAFNSLKRKGLSKENRKNKEERMIELYRLYDKAYSKEEKNEYLKRLNKLIEGE